MNAYTRNHMADDLAAHLKIPVTQSKQAVEFMLNRLADTLAAGNKIEFRGFGILTPQKRKEKLGRNPRNPAAGTYTIPAKTVVRFRAGKELDEKLNISPK